MFFVRIAQLTCLFVLIHLLVFWAPAVDGWMSPVISQFSIRFEETDTPNTTRLFIDFRKDRDCAFRRLEWYLGEPGKNNIPLTAIYEFQPPIVRGGAYYEGWGPVDLLIGKNLFVRNTFAVTVHDCYNGWLWETRTLVYMGKDSIIYGK